MVSPHIGDMGTLRSEQVFAQVAADLQRLYDVRAEIVLSDAHPDYATTRWARASGLEHVTVQHHRAHASALVTEHSRHGSPAIVFAWDGVGQGDDGTLWGGETFIGRPGRWQRVATLRPFHLPGGDRAGRGPGAARRPLCWELGPSSRATCRTRSCAAPGNDGSIRRNRVPRVGLFDAAAALVLGLGETSFEGQGPMWLEAIAGDVSVVPRLSLRLGAAGLITVDWAPLIEWLLQERARPAARAGGSRTRRAGHRHRRRGHTLRERTGSRTVGLTGGVFQNRRLSELAHARLQDAGFDVLLPERIPCNDGGLSYRPGRRLRRPKRLD